MHAEIDVIIHATENYNRIMKAIEKTLGITIRRIERKDLSGHYGNPIIYCKIRVGPEQTRQLLEKMKESLDETDKYYLMERIDEYFYKNTLYLRLDKQMLCKNTTKLVINDPLRIVIKNINLDKLKKILFK